jgi:hypothetical protein
VSAPRGQHHTHTHTHTTHTHTTHHHQPTNNTPRRSEQDVPVWAHKRYEPAPRLSMEEGAVKLYRGWVKQFMAGGVTFAEAQRAWLRKELGLEDSEAMAW